MKTTIRIEVGYETDPTGERTHAIVKVLKGYGLNAWVFTNGGVGVAIETRLNEAANAIDLFQEALRSVSK